MIGLQGARVALLGPHGVDAGDRGDDADGAGAEREHQAEAGLAPMAAKAGTPRMIDATSVTSYDSKRSAAMPAQSPTLSPTLSAIVAGLRGSSSGMPASTLPTRSAPTSAALVKMPPPTRRNRAMQRAAEAEPDEDRRARVLEHHDDQRRAEQAEADGEHAGDAAGAEGDLEGGGKRAGLGRGRGAHVAARRQRHADVAGETGQQGAGDERQRAERARLRPRQRHRARRASAPRSR